MLQVGAYITKYQADMQKVATGTTASRGNFLTGALFSFPKLFNSLVFQSEGIAFVTILIHMLFVDFFSMNMPVEEVLKFCAGLISGKALVLLCSRYILLLICIW